MIGVTSRGYVQTFVNRENGSTGPETLAAFRTGLTEISSPNRRGNPAAMQCSQGRVVVARQHTVIYNQLAEPARLLCGGG